MLKIIKTLETLKNEAKYKMRLGEYYSGQYSAYHKALELIKREIKTVDNKCVCCGAVIPEGRICPVCENV